MVIADIDADTYKSIGDKFGIKDYPTIKYFAPHSQLAQAYTKGHRIQDFIDFMNDKAGTEIVTDQGIHALTGRDEELDSAAHELMKLMREGGAVDSVMEFIKNRSITASRTNSVARYYYTVASIIVKGGSDALTKERTRVMKLAGSNQITVASRREFMIKINILSQFY